MRRSRIQSTVITLYLTPLLWLEDLTPLAYQNRPSKTSGGVAGEALNTFSLRLQHGPLFLRGMFSTNESQRASSGHSADTFLATPGFVKGLAFINGFNLGWYWPLKGPQQHLYIPGPLMKVGENELVLLELEAAPIEPRGELVDAPDFTSFRPLTETKLRTHALP